MSARRQPPPQTDDKKARKKHVDLLHRLIKGKTASAGVTDLGLIKTVYARAVVFGGESGDVHRGLPSLLALGGTAFCLWLSLRALHAVIDPDPFYAGRLAPIITDSVAVAGFGLGALLFFLYFYTFTFFLPSDDSVIFDRGNRKVHWVSMQLTGKTRRAALKRPVIEVRSVDWDLVDAEHRVIIKINTASASRDHDLAFVVRKSSTDATTVDEFGLAPSMLLGETTVPALWEHIRRYMEERGPSLPPGVTAPSLSEPKPCNWWQSMGLIGPFGPKYMQWWKKQPGLTLAAHLLLPLSLPVYFAWGALNWLTYATEQKVQWPQDVLDALGPALSMQDLQAGKGSVLAPHGPRQ